MVAILAVGSAAFTAPKAVAYDPPAPVSVYKKVATYKAVKEAVIVKVPFEKEVIRHDECGKPYCVTVVCYREVTEYVSKTVPVVNWVKVCY